MYQVDFNHPIHVYFIGIGGISMSGLAEILLSEGFTVSGSDWNRSALTEHLEKSGAHVNYGKPQKAENITDDIDLVVYTAAVHADNQEFSRAKELQLPMLSRAEFLGQLMKNYDTPIAVSGTHGKTTTTSMISEILLQANADPTLSVGGILKSIHGNIRVGHSGLFVAEACEYTNSFLSFFPKIGIILNIEEDHLDFFKDLADIRASFRKFAQLLPADGTLFINGDIENWQEITEGLACRVVTFGTTSASDYYPSDISYNKTADATFTVHSLNGQTRQLTLGVPGEHNISNALAAVALSDLLGIDYRDTAAALLNFRGTDRRFEYKGTINGITIVDDYAHHPTEIATIVIPFIVPFIRLKSPRPCTLHSTIRTRRSGAFSSLTPTPERKHFYLSLPSPSHWRIRSSSQISTPPVKLTPSASALPICRLWYRKRVKNVFISIHSRKLKTSF